MLRQKCFIGAVLFLCFCNSWQTILTDSKTESHTWKEVFQLLGFNLTLTKETQVPLVNATPFVDPNQPNQVALSRDVNLFSSNGRSFIRLYIPLELPRTTKLPVIIFVHGGGFVSSSASSSVFHDYCNNLAAQVRALVASVEYRLAPEHPLPAAYEDAMEAIFWVHSQATNNRGCDSWLNNYADFSRVFLMGSSAGGNIVYHSALRAMDFNLLPMKIQGVLLHQPAFGGIERTSSELRLMDDAHLPLYMSDALWSLTLPFQANRDHEFCNPFIFGFERVRRLSRWFVADCEGDPMIDRSREFVRRLKFLNVPVVHIFNPGGFHGLEIYNKTAALALFKAVKDFIYSTGGAELEVSRASY